MACRETDERIFEIVRKTVPHIILVSDEAMEHAARWLWFEAGVAADLSGAASIAAFAERRSDPRGMPVDLRARLRCGA